MLVKADDPYLALLAYRSTPLQNGFSPAELLMGRKLRSTVPVAPKNLEPKLPNQRKLRSKEKKYRAKQKINYDVRHRAKELPPLKQGDKVWIHDQRKYGSVASESRFPRSYHVQTDSGVYRRNRRHLSVIAPSKVEQHDQAMPVENSKDLSYNLDTESENSAQPTQEGTYVTRYGREVRPPDRLMYSE